jgi:hypothetical protein
MKKLILSIVLPAICSLTLFAARSPQNDGNSVSVTETRVTLADANTVSVDFRLHVGEGVTARNRSMVIRPVLKGVEGQVELLPIVIRGERAKASSEIRAMTLAGVNPEGRYVTGNGTVLEYHAQVQWEEWMAGSQLVFNGLNVGTGKPTEVLIGKVAEDLLMEQAAMYADQAPSAAVAPGTLPASVHGTPSAPVPALTVGDELASRFTFIEPVINYNAARNLSSIDAVFDYNMPLVFGTAVAKQDDEVSRFIEMTRLGALNIKFDRGSNMVARELGQNNQMLVDLISSIRVLDENPTTRVAQVVVVGFSAPEGASDEKETLAVERAGVVRDFLTANSRIDPGTISTYNGSVDWATLRALVAESNMSDKYKVLDIIDNVPAWGSTQDKGRMDYLMALEGGSPFRYIRENFFPQLRQTGAYIKVYYENIQQ